MAIVQHLSLLALRQAVDGACQFLGVTIGDHAIERVTGFLADHFTNHSQSLARAMQNANDSAWKALEIALAGESLWNWLDSADSKAFREQVRAFLDAAPLGGLPGNGPEFRQLCLKELRQARKQGLLSGALEPEQLARRIGEFARFSDPQQVLDAEWLAITGLAEDCRQAGFTTLALLVSIKPAAGPGPETNRNATPLLVVAVRFFFRRAIETDQELYQGLSWAKLELLQVTQEQAFRALTEVLAKYGDRLETMLASVQIVVVQTHQAVLDIQSEVTNLAKRFDLLHRELRPRDSMSIANDVERQLVKQLVKRYRALPEEERRRFPSLLNQVGKLEVAAGSFADAQRDFDQAAALAPDQAARAEAHFNRFNAALEAGDLTAALDALRQAVEQQPEKYALFPAKKYEPESILGAGGFGVAFLCRNKLTGSRVVIKALRTDTLARDLTEVFREAQVLEELDHPAIIRLRDCDYADAAMTRPYLVMDYFEGQTLERFIADNGPLTSTDLIALMRTVAEALEVAHARGILHRDVKPGNVLVRRLPGEPGTSAPRWRVKLIDFGLALKQNVLQTSQVADGPRTVAGYSIAGTLDYAAPEQLGKLPGAAVGPHTDVYGLAKTCCQALFKTTQPLRKHWRDIPEELADLLEQCLSESPKDRLPNCGKVLEALHRIGVDASAHAPAKVEPIPSSRAPVEPIAEPVTGTATEKATGQRQREWWRTGPVGAVEIGAIVHRLTGHSDAVLSLAFSPDGTHLLSASADHTVRLWDVMTGQELKQMFGHTDKVWNVQFIGGSGTPMVGDTPGAERGPRLWDQVSSYVGELLGTATAAQAGGSQFAVSGGADRSVRFWDLHSGTEVRCLAARTSRNLAVSPDGSLALTGNLADGMIRVWEVKTGRELRRLKGHVSWVLSLAFAPSGRQALSGSADGTVRLWDIHSGRELQRLRGHADRVWSVAVALGGNEALSASADKTVRWWDLRTGKELKCYHQYRDQVWSVAYSLNGQLALSDSDSGSLRLWEPKTNREFPPLQGHTAKALCVAFSPDGRMIASGGEDKTIIIWQVPG